MIVFDPPTRLQSVQAIGDIRTIALKMQRTFDPVGDFESLPIPEPDDWLSVHYEPGQSFDDFLPAPRHVPDKIRNIIYLQPFGEFPKDRGLSLELLNEFTALFFSLDVRVLPSVSLSEYPVRSRIHPVTNRLQLHTRDILNFLGKRIPSNAFCILAITREDLYPSDSWNFVFGEASIHNRTGIFSFARYLPGFYGNGEVSHDDHNLVLKRCLKVLIHETAHMFSIYHCTYFRCVMNGSNHLQESDARPLTLCPVCLRKLHHSIGFDIVGRYQRLQGFYQRNGFLKEAGWIEKRLKWIENPIYLNRLMKTGNGPVGRVGSHSIHSVFYQA